MCVKSKWMIAKTIALTAPAIKKFDFCTSDPKITRRKMSSSKMGAKTAIDNIATGAAAANLQK